MTSTPPPQNQSWPTPQSLPHINSTKHTSKCLWNAGDDEPIFVLRAKDITSPKVVRYWVKQNSKLQKVSKMPLQPPLKCAEALALANDMEAWKMKQPGVSKWVRNLIITIRVLISIVSFPLGIIDRIFIALSPYFPTMLLASATWMWQKGNTNMGIWLILLCIAYGVCNIGYKYRK